MAAIRFGYHLSPVWTWERDGLSKVVIGHFWAHLFPIFKVSCEALAQDLLLIEDFHPNSRQLCRQLITSRSKVCIKDNTLMTAPWYVTADPSINSVWTSSHLLLDPATSQRNCEDLSSFLVPSEWLEGAGKQYINILRTYSSHSAFTKHGASHCSTVLLRSECCVGAAVRWISYAKEHIKQSRQSLSQLYVVPFLHSTRNFPPETRRRKTWPPALLRTLVGSARTKHLWSSSSHFQRQKVRNANCTYLHRTSDTNMGTSRHSPAPRHKRCRQKQTARGCPTAAGPSPCPAGGQPSCCCCRPTGALPAMRRLHASLAVRGGQGRGMLANSYQAF